MTVTAIINVAITSITFIIIITIGDISIGIIFVIHVHFIIIIVIVIRNIPTIIFILILIIVIAIAIAIAIAIVAITPIIRVMGFRFGNSFYFVQHMFNIQATIINDKPIFQIPISRFFFARNGFKFIYFIIVIFFNSSIGQVFKSAK